MYMPSIFGESLFDDMFPFDDSFFTSKKNPLYGKNASRVMKTDIKENEGSYELDIDLPGFKKDEGLQKNARLAVLLISEVSAQEHSRLKNW